MSPDYVLTLHTGGCSIESRFPPTWKSNPGGLRSARFSPRRPELATEHLLLGLVSADHEVAVWLRQCGLDPNAIEAEIRRFHGYELTSDDRVAADRLLECGDLSPLSEERSELPHNAAARKKSGDESPQSKDTDVLRVLDAAANRAREGLRSGRGLRPFRAGRPASDRAVQAIASQPDRRPVPDFHRQPNGRPRNAGRCRHRVEHAFGTTPRRFGQRRAANSPGCRNRSAAWKNSANSSKAELSESFKQLRYRTYTIERAVEITRGSIERLARSGSMCSSMAAARPKSSSGWWFR